jgi:hypothetical protein
VWRNFERNLGPIALKIALFWPLCTYWVVFGSIKRTLPLPYYFLSENTFRENIRHSFLPAQIHYTTPANHIVKAINDLRSALRSKTNKQGVIEMDILCQMHAILNSDTVANNIKKKVTFAQPIPDSRVAVTVTFPNKLRQLVVVLQG